MDIIYCSWKLDGAEEGKSGNRISLKTRRAAAPAWRTRVSWHENRREGRYSGMANVHGSLGIQMRQRRNKRVRSARLIKDYVKVMSERGMRKRAGYGGMR